jgi:hypothetical protein
MGAHKHSICSQKGLKLPHSRRSTVLIALPFSIPEIFRNHGMKYAGDQTPQLRSNAGDFIQSAFIHYTKKALLISE